MIKNLAFTRLEYLGMNVKLLIFIKNIDAWKVKLIYHILIIPSKLFLNPVVIFSPTF
jgi:hypothetical protein